MIIKDKFGRGMRDLRISVTDRCNLRCFYCMPANPVERDGVKYTFLPKNEILNFEEITRLGKIFAGLGIKKIRLTGGEPLIRKDMEELISFLAGINGVEDIALTTNGCLLHQKARALKDAGLNRLTVSLDSLDDVVFKKINGREYGVDRVLMGIKKAENAGFGQLKINAVVRKGINDHTLIDLARHFKGTAHIVRFIEYMDVGNLNRWDMKHVVPADNIIAKINTVFPLEKVKPNYKGEVALRYRYKDGSGEIGIIASVTKPFCTNCTRIRLSTGGKLYTCLFAAQSIDLRNPLRMGAGDNELKGIILNAWKNREDRYSELRNIYTSDQLQPKKIEMFKIGG